MGKYNFDKVAKRKNTNSLKWDTYPDDLPMWVADMDFETFPLIKESLTKRLNIKAYGYSNIDPKFYSSISQFFLRNHDVRFDQENIIFTTGVVPAISSMVRRLTKPGEKVLLLSPVYNIFYNSILNNGCKVLTSDLVYKNKEYSIDFKDLEEKMSDPLVNLMIFCNPHNPVGRIWTKKEISKVGELARKHGVIVISDEIHCDIVEPGESYNSFYTDSKNRQNSIICVSASKSFNLAGLQGAAVICDNDFLKNRIERGFNNDEIAEPNFFVIDAFITAFTFGDDYLKELNEYIFKNKEIVKEFLSNQLKEIKYIEGKATYLIWLDIQEITDNVDEFVEYIAKRTGLRVASGKEYGINGESFIRMNVATSKQNVLNGLLKLKKGVDSYLKNVKNKA